MEAKCKKERCADVRISLSLMVAKIESGTKYCKTTKCKDKVK